MDGSGVLIFNRICNKEFFLVIMFKLLIEDIVVCLNFLVFVNC